MPSALILAPLGLKKTSQFSLRRGWNVSHFNPSPAQTASSAQTAPMLVTLQLHWTLNSREVPEKQVKNTDIEKLPRFSIPQETSKFLNPFTVH